MNILNIGIENISKTASGTTTNTCNLAPGSTKLCNLAPGSPKFSYHGSDTPNIYNLAPSLPQLYIMAAGLPQLYNRHLDYQNFIIWHRIYQIINF